MACSLLAGYTPSDGGVASAPRALATPEHIVAPTPTPTPTSTPQMVIVPSAPVRLEIPVAGIDSEIGQFEAGSDYIEPAEDEVRPMWPTNYGSMIGGGNSTYIVGHSSRYTEGSDKYVDRVFNRLFDRWAQKSNVNVGDAIYITTAAAQRICYTVYFVDAPTKEWLSGTQVQPDDASQAAYAAALAAYPFYKGYPDEAHLATCFQGIDDVPSVNQLVIVAKQGGTGCN